LATERAMSCSLGRPLGGPLIVIGNSLQLRRRSNGSILLTLLERFFRHNDY